MSFARWGVNGSDVYVIGNEAGYWECVGCDGPNACSKDIEAFFGHLKWHRDQGHNVPRIEDDMRESAKEWGWK